MKRNNLISGYRLIDPKFSAHEIKINRKMGKDIKKYKNLSAWMINLLSDNFKK